MDFEMLTLKERIFLRRLLSSFHRKKETNWFSLRVNLTTPEQVELTDLIAHLEVKGVQSPGLDWKTEFNKQREYSVALEHSRSDLWGVNQELRDKILALEAGQDYLKDQLISALRHSGCPCDSCRFHFKVYTEVLDERDPGSLKKIPPDSF